MCCFCTLYGNFTPRVLHLQMNKCISCTNAYSFMLQEKGQLLENVFADPKGFGIAPDGRYRYELPGFSAGTAAVS